MKISHIFYVVFAFLTVTMLSAGAVNADNQHHYQAPTVIEKTLVTENIFKSYGAASAAALGLHNFDYSTKGPVQFSVSLADVNDKKAFSWGGAKRWENSLWSFAVASEGTDYSYGGAVRLNW